MTDEANKGVSPEVLETWIHPRDALTRAAAALGSRSNASEAIQARLRGALIISAYSHARRNYVPAYIANYIPAAHWEKAASSLTSSSVFWQSGDIEIDLSTYRGQASVAYFGVRFQPHDIDNLLGPHEQQAAAPVESPANVQAPPKAKKPLPLALLDEWAALFRKAYPMGPEKMAVQSVDGMFPEHEVSRARLRTALRKVGALKRGQKPVKNGD